MSRSLVKKAVHFECPKHIPIWTEDIGSDAIAKYGDALRAILHEFPGDMIELKYDPPTGWSPREAGEDEWGCVWCTLDGTVGQVLCHPIDTWDTCSSWTLPAPGAPGRFDTARQRRDAAGDLYAFGTNQFTLFERLRFLRGDKALFEDLCDNPAPLTQTIDRIVSFNLELIGHWHDVGVDCIRFTDDWGTQQGLLISPEMWRSYFKPCYKLLFSETHRLGMDVQFHSCGNIMLIIRDLIECGVDILNPIQPGAMDPDAVGECARGRVCCMGAIDTQRTLRVGSPEAVRDEVFRAVRALGTPNGGYVCCPATTILEDIPLLNIEALFRSAKEFCW